MLWYPIVVSALMGVALLGLWGRLLFRSAIPELNAGLPSIRFHIVVELLTAAALLGSAIWLAVADSPTAHLAATASLGAIAYSTINSPGYYADRGNWTVVVMFGALTVIALTAILVLLMA
jgi:hypothetical protein